MLAEHVQRFAFPQLHDEAATHGDAQPPLSAVARAAEEALRAELVQVRTAAMTAGHAEGLAAGLAAGRAAAAAQINAECEARVTATQRIEAAVTGIGASIDDTAGDAVMQVVEALVRQIVAVELQTNRAVIARLTEAALAQLRDAVKPLALVLNPADRVLLATAALPLRDDAQLKRGEIRLETSEGFIEASLNTRLTNALATIAASAL